MNDEQRKEVEDFIVAKNLQPKIVPNIYKYMPSNYAQEELSAHTKTLEAQSLGMFTLSDEKNEFYAKEIARYRSMYEKCVFIEERDGITPEGYPK